MIPGPVEALALLASETFNVYWSYEFLFLEHLTLTLHEIGRCLEREN